MSTDKINKILLLMLWLIITLFISNSILTIYLYQKNQSQLNEIKQFLSANKLSNNTITNNSNWQWHYYLWWNSNPWWQSFRDIIKNFEKNNLLEPNDFEEQFPNFPKPEIGKPQIQQHLEFQSYIIINWQKILYKFNVSNWNLKGIIKSNDSTTLNKLKKELINLWAEIISSTDNILEIEATWANVKKILERFNINIEF